MNRPIVDKEFRALLPPLTPDQRAGLEASILAQGILSPLLVWEETGVLLDGHNRFEIATREEITFPTRTVKLASREAAVEWIFANQRDRRNLTPDQLALVMGRHYNLRKQIGHSGRKNYDHPGERACEVLAKDYGVVAKTVWSNGKYAAAVDTLRAVDPDIEQKVVTGKGPTRKAVIAAAATGDPDEAKAVLAGGDALPKPKLEKHKRQAKAGPPCEGMAIARRAAGILNEIRNDDTERTEALAFMRRWIDAHEA